MDDDAQGLRQAEAIAPENLNIPETIKIDNHSERYWEILQHNVEWLKFSETKAAVIITVYGVIFTMVYTNAQAVFTSIQFSKIIYWLVIAYGAISLLSILFAFLCINPILKNKNPSSMIYFGHISTKHAEFADYKIYAKSILDDEEKFTDQLTEQIHFVSKIAWKKFFRVTWSLRLFIFSLLIMLSTMFYYLFISID